MLCRVCCAAALAFWIAILPPPHAALGYPSLDKTTKTNKQTKPLRLEIKKKLQARSDRVKSVDMHPTENWVLSALYNGKVFLWDYEKNEMVKSFDICDLPVRCAKVIQSTPLTPSVSSISPLAPDSRLVYIFRKKKRTPRTRALGVQDTMGVDSRERESHIKGWARAA